MHSHGPDWTAVLTAISTTGAFFAAGFAVYLANEASNRVIKLESDRDVEAKRIQRSAQAIQIAGWIRTNPEIEEYKNLTHPLSNAAIIKNPSLQPIFNVVVLWRFNDQSYATGQAHMIPPYNGYHSCPIPLGLLMALNASGFNLNATLFQNTLMHSDAVAELEPHNGSIVVGPNYAWWIAARASEEMAKQFQLIFAFTDIEGVRWQRDANGHLSESPLPPT